MVTSSDNAAEKTNGYGVTSEKRKSNGSHKQSSKKKSSTVVQENVIDVKPHVISGNHQHDQDLVTSLPVVKTEEDVDELAFDNNEAACAVAGLETAEEDEARLRLLEEFEQTTMKLKQDSENDDTSGYNEMLSDFDVGVETDTSHNLNKKRAASGENNVLNKRIKLESDTKYEGDGNFTNYCFKDEHVSSVKCVENESVISKPSAIDAPCPPVAIVTPLSFRNEIFSETISIKNEYDAKGETETKSDINSILDSLERDDMADKKESLIKPSSDFSSDTLYLSDSDFERFKNDVLSEHTVPHSEGAFTFTRTDCFSFQNADKSLNIAKKTLTIETQIEDFEKVLKSIKDTESNLKAEANGNVSTSSVVTSTTKTFHAQNEFYKPHSDRTDVHRNNQLLQELLEHEQDKNKAFSQKQIKKGDNYQPNVDVSKEDILKNSQLLRELLEHDTDTSIKNENASKHVKRSTSVDLSFLTSDALAATKTSSPVAVFRTRTIDPLPVADPLALAVEHIKEESDILTTDHNENKTSDPGPLSLAEQRRASVTLHHKVPSFSDLVSASGPLNKMNGDETEAILNEIMGAQTSGGPSPNSHSVVSPNGMQYDFNNSSGFNREGPPSITPPTAMFSTNSRRFSDGDGQHVMNGVGVSPELRMRMGMTNTGIPPGFASGGRGIGSLTQHDLDSMPPERRQLLASRYAQMMRSGRGFSGLPENVSPELRGVHNPIERVHLTNTSPGYPANGQSEISGAGVGMPDPGSAPQYPGNMKDRMRLLMMQQMHRRRMEQEIMARQGQGQGSFVPPDKQMQDPSRFHPSMHEKMAAMNYNGFQNPSSQFYPGMMDKGQFPRTQLPTNGQSQVQPGYPSAAGAMMRPGGPPAFQRQFSQPTPQSHQQYYQQQQAQLMYQRRMQEQMQQQQQQQQHHQQSRHAMYPHNQPQFPPTSRTPPHNFQQNMNTAKLSSAHPSLPNTSMTNIPGQMSHNNHFAGMTGMAKPAPSYGSDGSRGQMDPASMPQMQGPFPQSSQSQNGGQSLPMMQRSLSMSSMHYSPMSPEARVFAGSPQMMGAHQNIEPDSTGSTTTSGLGNVDSGDIDPQFSDLFF